MTARNDPLARVQAMVSAWGETELFDTFDTTTCEVSPLNPLENCGFGHSRHFRHQELEHASTRDASAHAQQKAHEQESAARVVSYSSGVESVESVENDRKGRKDSDLIFDTSSPQVSKNGGQVSKTGRSAALEAPVAAVAAPMDLPAAWARGGGQARRDGMPGALPPGEVGAGRNRRNGLPAGVGRGSRPAWLAHLGTVRLSPPRALGPDPRHGTGPATAGQ